MAPHVGGIIMIPIGREVTDSPTLIDLIKRLECPVVFLERDVAQPDVHLVASSNEHGGLQAGRHLVQQLRARELRQRRLVAVVKDGSTGQEQRLAGFRRSIADVSLTTECQIITMHPRGRSLTDFVNALAPQLDELVRFVRERREANDLPCAGLFCAADNVALATLKVLRSYQIEAPRDVLVIGFDDLFAAGASDLSTIRQDFTRMVSRRCAV